MGLILYSLFAKPMGIGAPMDSDRNVSSLNILKSSFFVAERAVLEKTAYDKQENLVFAGDDELQQGDVVSAGDVLKFHDGETDAVPAPGFDLFGQERCTVGIELPRLFDHPWIGRIQAREALQVALVV